MAVRVRVLKSNFTLVEIGMVTLWFSYETVVAFSHPRVDAGRRKVCENMWSTTTGRHLNEIDGGDKKSRLKRDDFIELVKQHIETIGEEKDEPKGAKGRT